MSQKNKMSIKEMLKLDLKAAMEKDPAATSIYCVKHYYSGYKAIKAYRYAHWYYERGMKCMARYISAKARHKTGIEIHPASKIGYGVFIDHGSGVVIGETCEIGNNVLIYQGVTLGGTGKDVGKRHPTIEDDVMISCGAKVLGPLTIGKGSKIGSGSVVLKSVPPYCTVVGVPGRIVKQDGERVSDMNQILLPDPILEEFRRLNSRIVELEKKCGIKTASVQSDSKEFFAEAEKPIGKEEK